MSPEAKRAGDEPAFPWGSAGDRYGGLTKREEFAKAAMVGLLAEDQNCNWGAPLVARYAVEQADALLAELAEPAAQDSPHPSLTYDQAREAIIKAGAPYCGYTDRAVTAIDVAQRLDIPAGKALVESAAAILPRMQDGLSIQRTSGNRQPWQLQKLAELERAVENVRRIAAGEELPE